MGAGVALLGGGILAMAKIGESCPETFSHLGAAGFGTVFGLLLGYGGYWFKTGERSSSPTFLLHAAAGITAMATAPVVFWIHAMLRSRGEASWSGWVAAAAELVVITAAIALGLKRG